jgi:hypothetical protein
MPAAAGVATGSARIVHDPATARIEPGDILVAATTDLGGLRCSSLPAAWSPKPGH